MHWRIGRACGVVVMIAAAASASAGPVTREGLAWTAKPSVVRNADGPALRWTVTARNLGKQTRALACTWFSVREERGHLVKGKFVLDGMSVTRQPAAGCAAESPTKVTRRASWTSELAAPETSMRSEEVIRAHVEATVGDGKSFEIAAVMVTLSPALEPVIKPLAAEVQ
ncbi:MAG TPA: hypothetical protein VIV40_38045 [Kofleriaceae bacterium]